jgi:hypothetical protein
MVPLKVMCLIDSAGDEDEIGYVECGEEMRGRDTVRALIDSMRCIECGRGQNM